MTTIPITTRVFLEGESLTHFITEHLPTLREKSILAVTSKIVALAEQRTASGGQADKDHLVRQESRFAIRTKHTWLTLKDGMLMASAGIDESNGNGKFILLPRNSSDSAKRIRQALRKKYRLKHLGVVITDSRTMPLRAGTIGVALGYAGFLGSKDYRGRQDIFGRTMLISRLNVADSLATTAVLVMGEGAEKQPLAVIQNTPVTFCDRIPNKELTIDPRDDMYGPLLRRLPQKPQS